MSHESARANPLWNIFSCAIVILSLTLLLPLDAEAKKKKKKGKNQPPIVEVGDYWTTTISIKTGKSKSKKKGKKKSGEKTYEVDCLSPLGGQVRNKKAGLQFWSYQRLKTDAKKKMRKANNNKQKQKWGNKTKLYGKLLKASASACAQSPDEGDGDGDGSGDEPTEEIDFEPYTGEFGENQARILFDRFCFGGTPAQIQRAVAEGLDATVTRLLTYVSEPNIDTAMNDIACDRYLKSEQSESEEECDSRDPNDFRTDGFRQAVYYRIIHSENCLFNRMALFLHDEKLAASADSISSRRRHLIKEHLVNLDRAARTGDYIRYMEDMNSDGLVAYSNLDLGSNNKFAPNENYAREFWEILTVGPSDDDGAPLYNVLDIAQSSLAFTGGGWQQIEIDLGDGESAYVDYPSYSNLSHATGSKTIFFGTPFQASVDDGDDVLDATIAHPYLARHIARELLEEFLVPNPSRQAVGTLARTVRDNNYNFHEAFRVLMKSQELYAENNRKVLLKHAWDFLFGFLRTTQYPVDHREIDWYLQDLGQQIFRSPSIFGWDTDKLNAERYVLERRNIVIHMMRMDHESLQERGYNLYDLFISGLPQDQLPERALVAKIGQMLGVRMNTNQRSLAEDYLNYRYNACDNDSEVEEYGCQRCSYGVDSSDPFYCDETAEHYQYRDGIDLHPDGEFETKLQGLITILLTSPDYLTK